jgi:dipeptidyl aminopeptidase/acylaminoacyl peptidase
MNPNAILPLRRLAVPASLAALSLVLLSACTAPPPPNPDEKLRPNANLVAQGIPEIPMTLVQQVERYTEFRGHSFVDWHPRQREMLVAHRKAGASTTQIFRIASPLGGMEQLTDFGDPVTSASYEPQQGRYIVFERATGGNEVTQLYRLDLDSKNVTLLTDPGERHDPQGWLHGSSRMLVASVPLDRTAEGGSRASINTHLWLIDPLDPANKRKVAELPGVGWFGGTVSWDDRQFAMTRHVSATESQLWLLDLGSGAMKQLLPAAAGAGSDRKAVYQAAAFARDNSNLYIVSDRAGEFRELMRYSPADGQFTRISSHIPWDIMEAESTRDGSFLAARANVEARNELRLFNGRTLKEVPLTSLPSGSVSGLRFHPGRGDLAFAVSNAQGPSQIYTLDPQTGRTEQWTRAAVPSGVNPNRFADQQVVQWVSFDRRVISGLLNMPPASFTGKRPVVVLIHGGPEAQATVGFMNRYNYLINELGVAVIQPNVRGSAGFGKTFLALDDGMKREDSVKDIGALLDWIGTQPRLDASRVLVMGGSYGGYMTLATSVMYGDRIAGAIDAVGISHFVTFLTSTESYRRDLRRTEYGDERDPAMRAFLHKISPLTNADRIRKPLFVVQGKNDPRVPVTEAEQIVAKVRATGTPVWYLRAENEGHGFAKKENADFQFYAGLMFMRETLLK